MDTERLLIALAVAVIALIAADWLRHVTGGHR
jgi:hypothetical protein